MAAYTEKVCFSGVAIPPHRFEKKSIKEGGHGIANKKVGSGRWATVISSIV